MAASDKPFNNQHTLDIVFGVSNILMLLSVIWMCWQDYHREWKTEQRLFRNVEVGIAQRQALESLPSPKEFDDAEKDVEKWRAYRKEHASSLESAQAELIRLQPEKQKAEAHFQDVKADVESFTSLLNIAVEHGDEGTAKKYRDLLADRNAKLAEAQARRDKAANDIKEQQLKIDDVEGKLTKAVAAFKKVNDKLDTQVKVALSKRWGLADSIRSLWIIDGFASPLKIHQFTINDIPIDYNFKQVTRFDRCMSCHQGIDRPAYTRENLMKLTSEDAHKENLEAAKELYKKRVAVLDPKDAAVIPNPSDLSLITISDKVLTPSRVTEFCAHPRLDLYVGSNSKHPTEKFGCTSCHSGQGSGTSFTDASHSPNTMKERDKWAHERGYEFNHMWDFPMHATRFVESSCLKCHHEVTDLVGRDNRIEAPRLFRGYNLIKEVGCFGCHEISGWKGGARVGPDLRLEPNPPLEEPYSLPIEIVRAKNDTDNRPGTLRKVGPSLARVKEKVSEDWIKKWLRSPSAFRPDTKMPHYYGLSTNDKSILPEDQKTFPDTEMVALAYFLTTTSKNYIGDFEKFQKTDTEAARQEDQMRLLELLNKGRLIEDDKIKEQTELAQIKERMRLRREVPLVDLAPKYAGKAAKGRELFIEKGCLACHTHQATGSATEGSPAIMSEATFGPNLSQVAEKFGDKKTGRTWLIQWIMNPQVHSPRSKMPVTHLTADQAADIATWLLEQPYPRGKTDPWNEIKIEQPKREDLENLARVYLTRMLSTKDMDKFLKGQLTKEEYEIVKSDLTKDEQTLKDKVGDDKALTFYLGKKAVTRLGCFGCHDIPGFETTKSIGVGLNDWGKKMADRLAFEDIGNFFTSHYQTEDPANVKDGKQPYDPFFADALIGHYPNRIGYLNQKLRDPRSYDYNRIRTWDDRARMPQFNFARPRKKSGEKEDDYTARKFKDEADAREAVATFVLGLTAELVPAKSINQPTGDRMAEVKGRQVLDKYNCAGCHTIRPGTFDFSPGEKTQAFIEGTQKRGLKDALEQGEILYLNHHNWVGRNPLGLDRLTAFGVQPIVTDEGKLQLTLSEALRFIGKDQSVKNIFGGDVTILIDLADVSSQAPITTQADFNQAFAASAPYGGTFADLLVPYLIKKNEDTYKPVVVAMSGKKQVKDSALARASVPPILIGQGERTQPDWLFQFLVNPQPVRRMTILRMPKFNMSKDEAAILKEYFGAVSRLNNPGIGVPTSFDVIPPRADINGPYWEAMTKEYVERLKKTNAGGKNLYDQRVAEYKKAWEQIRTDEEPRLKSAIEARTKSIAARAEEAKTEKDPEKKKALEGEVEALKEEKAGLEKAREQLDIGAQEKLWSTQEAYAADAFRLLTARDLCTKCHQVGSMTASQKDLQGPPLDLAFDRLRPDWVERWVDKPQRFVPYPSLMPPYFNRPHGAPMKYGALLAGTPEEQIRALRDALMNYPRISELKVNRR